MLFAFFLIIYLYFSIPALLSKFFNPIAELVMPTGIQTKEAKTGIEKYPVTSEAKTSQCSI